MFQACLNSSKQDKPKARGEIAMTHDRRIPTNPDITEQSVSGHSIRGKASRM